MFLGDVAAASADVTATSSRLAKVARIAELLGSTTDARLVMIAVSQGGFQVIDPDYWKRIIRELAAVKINMIMPYFETGSYDYERYPFMRIKGPDGFTADRDRRYGEATLWYGRAAG